MIAIYAPDHSPRIDYALHLIFEVILGVGYKRFTDLESFGAADAFKINYSGIEVECDVHWIPQAFMTAEDIVKIEVTMGEWQQLPVLFPQSGAAIPFDLLAAAFYLATRYEEYLPHDADQHGRFPASASLAFKKGFLERPLIDEWVQNLRWYILKQRPDVRFKDRRFMAEMTFDIDVAWAYLHKGWLRAAGGFALDVVKLEFKKMVDRARVLLGLSRDPYDTYYYIRQLCDYHRVGAHYFFLLGDYSGYDRNSSHENKAMQDLIQTCAEHGPVGIHPSYGSHVSNAQLTKEIDRLAQILGEPVTHSRQHYLKMTMPETYRRLVDCGIQHDYTMGYAQNAGFRASLATSFPFFDLEKNEQTALWLHPFAYMDGTLRQYMQLSVVEARTKVSELIAAVRGVNGEFSCLWHNSSLTDGGEWKEWRSVFEHTLTECGDRRRT